MRLGGCYIDFPLWPSSYSDVLARAIEDTSAGLGELGVLSACNQRLVEPPTPGFLNKAIWRSEP